MIDIKETIIVEGKDDEANIRRAVNANILWTHGYGINEKTLQMIRAAYERSGIIIFTDPDHAGRKIRERLTAMFPDAGQAYLTYEQAYKKGDIGIENASPEDIVRALKSCNACLDNIAGQLTPDDMFELGLAGLADSAALREKLGSRLGIGFGNVKSFLKRLNYLHISREEIERILNEMNAS